MASVGRARCCQKVPRRDRVTTFDDRADDSFHSSPGHRGACEVSQVTQLYQMMPCSTECAMPNSTRSESSAPR